MRLGAQVSEIQDGTRSSQSYPKKEISERHRHRYEFNNTFRQQLKAHGLTIAATSENDSLVEIVEIADHPWFVAVQFHPEFKSKPTSAHPLFSGFIQAAADRSSNGAKQELEV